MLSVWFLENPYRILRLSVNAASADVHKSAASMRKMVLLNAIRPDRADYENLGPVARTEGSIRAALGRLESPAQRIVDRLFWFHRPVAGATTSAASDSAPRTADLRHDDALRMLFELSTQEISAENRSAWRHALEEWNLITRSADYCRLLARLEELCGFEPKATAEEINAIREIGMQRAAEPLLLRGRKALAEGADVTLSMLIQLFGDLEDTGDWAAKARREILDPLAETLSQACDENEKLPGAELTRENGNEEANRIASRTRLKHFRAFVQPALVRLQSITGAGAAEEGEAREKGALCLRDIAHAFTWGDEYLQAEELYEEALQVAAGTVAAIDIECNIASNKRSADKQRKTHGLRRELVAAIKELEDNSQALLNTGRSALIRESDKANHNKPVCGAMLLRFRTELVPIVTNLLAQLPKDHPAAMKIREDQALLLNSIATDYTWADAFVLSQQLREEALLIAAGLPITQTIKEGIARISESVHQERLYSGLTPVTRVPGLRTINGVGGMLYGKCDFDPATRSFCSTYYFTFLYFPIFPLKRYRVIQDGRSYRFLGTLPFRNLEKWHVRVAIALLVILFLVTASSNDKPAGQAAAPPNAPTQSSIAGEPAASPATPALPSPVVAASSDVPSTIGGTPSPVQPASVSEVPQDTNADQQSALKTQIETGRARMKELDSELDPVASELKDLKSRIDSLNNYLSALDSQKASGQTIDIDDYNNRVGEYNDLLAQRRALRSEHQASIDEYESLLKNDRVLVARYNASPQQ